MSEEAAFLNAIRATSCDDSIRLVYADWLDERGRPGGAFLRADCALTAAGPDEPRRVELQAGLRDAGAGFDPRWVASVSRVPIENCPAEFHPRCPKRWEHLSPVRAEASRHCDECQEEVVFCCTLGMAQVRASLGQRFAVDPRLARTPGDLEMNPDDVARLLHAAAYDTSQVDTSEFGSGKYEYVNAGEAIRSLEVVFNRRQFTDADAALVRLYPPDAPVMGATILRHLIPQTLPIIEAMLVDPLPRARMVAASALTWGRSHRDRGSCERAEKQERISEVWSRLLKLLDDEEQDVRSEAVHAIQRLHSTSRLIGGSYAALLRRLAIESDAGVRGVMIAALKWARLQQAAKLDLEPVRAVLLSELANRNYKTREDAAFLLHMHLRGPDVAAGMIGRLADPHPTVRMWASSYLVREGDTSDLPQLCAALITQLADRRHPSSQAEAARSLAKVGDAGILPQLRAAREEQSRGYSQWMDKPISHYIDDAIAAIESRSASMSQSKALPKTKRKRGK
jgi:uncharacterized protein (TIGR02996 family)